MAKENCIIVLAGQQFLLSDLWTDTNRTDVAIHVEFLTSLSVLTKNLVWQLHKSLMILSSF